MIKYNHGKFGVRFVLRWSGSVFPRALCWAIPATILAIILNLLKHYLEKETDTPANTVVVAASSFMTVMGVMVVFRSNQAWSRYWQGAMMLQGVRGEWFNAASSLFAFCDRKPENEVEIGIFQRRLVRLMSFLFASALQSVSGCSLEVLSQEGMDKEALSFLDECSNDAQTGSEMKCEVILQWVQRLIVDSTCDRVLSVPAPILSRVFQELSRGVVQIQGIRKINELPFPFPYAQMLSVLLMVYSVGVPCAAGYVMDSWWGAGGSTFINVFVLWGFNYLATEIENPFGSKENDLPIFDEMNKFNDLLRMLLHRRAQHPPSYHERNARHALRAVLQAGVPDLNRKMSRLLCKEKLLRSRSALDLDNVGSPAKKGPVRMSSSADLTAHEVLSDTALVEAWGDAPFPYDHEGTNNDDSNNSKESMASMVKEQSAFTGLVKNDEALILNWNLPQQPQVNVPFEDEVSEAPSVGLVVEGGGRSASEGTLNQTLNETLRFESSSSSLAGTLGALGSCRRAHSMPVEMDDIEEPRERQRRSFPKAPKPPVRVAGVPLGGPVLSAGGGFPARGGASLLTISKGGAGAPLEASSRNSRLSHCSQASLASASTATRRPSASMVPANSVPDSDVGSQTSLMWAQDSIASLSGVPKTAANPSMIS